MNTETVAVRRGGNTLGVVTEEAKRLAMKALFKSALTASGIGFMAFPNSGIRTPQAAALASGKLRRELQRARLIVFDATNASYSLSPSGRQWVEQNR